MSRCRALAVAMLAVGIALPAASASASVSFGDRSLRQGMRGHDVRVLQDFLTRVGIRTPVDGQFGPFTGRRVRTWERRSSLAVNGWVSRRDAAVLRGQVDSGARVLDAGPGGTAAPPAPPDKAVLGSDGEAIAPASAPDVVRAVIAAANTIVGRPYKYGGGHGRWEDSGYDCSGSESYALHGGGLIARPMNSTEYMSWGEPGPGVWITSYANGGHSFLVVAGLRFDTGWNSARSGPHWSTQMRPADGYVVRHPAGL